MNAYDLHLPACHLSVTISQPIQSCSTRRRLLPPALTPARSPFSPPPGFCGLVKVQDEDWVRPESSPQNTAAAGAHVQQQQQQPRPAAQLPPPQPFRRHVRGGNGGGAHTPPSGISPRSSPSVSPLRPAPGLAPREQQSAAALAEQAAVLLAQRGRLQEAESLLLTALRRCPITSTQLAGRICDLLIEAEREAQVTPTHSRQASEADAAVAAFDAGAAAGGGRGGEGGGGSVASLFRQATQALAKGAPRAGTCKALALPAKRAVGSGCGLLGYPRESLPLFLSHTASALVPSAPQGRSDARCRCCRRRWPTARQSGTSCGGASSCTSSWSGVNVNPVEFCRCSHPQEAC